MTAHFEIQTCRKYIQQSLSYIPERPFYLKTTKKTSAKKVVKEQQGQKMDAVLPLINNMRNSTHQPPIIRQNGEHSLKHFFLLIFTDGIAVPGFSLSKNRLFIFLKLICQLKRLHTQTRDAASYKKVGRVKKHLAASLPDRFFLIMIFSIEKEEHSIRGSSVTTFFLI